jgi:hypothetical protein
VLAPRRHKRRDRVGIDVGVAVGSGRGVRPPDRVGGGHDLLQGEAATAIAAAQAGDEVETPVEIDDRTTAGALVQAIDVLRHQLDERAGGFPGGEGAMRGIRHRGGEARPAGVGTRPVALVHRVLGAKRLNHHRRPPLPLALLVTVVGYARSGAAAGAGEREDATMAGNPAAQPIIDRGGRSHRRHGIADGSEHDARRNVTDTQECYCGK